MQEKMKNKKRENERVCNLFDSTQKRYRKQEEGKGRAGKVKSGFEDT